MHMQIDNERFRNLYYVKQFISYKWFVLINLRLSKSLGVWDTELSFVSVRHPLDVSMPCAFELFSYIAQHISRTVEKTSSLFLTSLAAACGAVGSNKKFKVACENIQSFQSSFDFKNVLQVATCPP